MQTRMGNMNSHRFQLCDCPMFLRGLSGKRCKYQWRDSRIGLRTDIMPRFLTITCLICLTWVMSGCVGNNHPELPSTDEIDQTSYEYSIGTGDLLNIFVWGYPDLGESIPVRPDGRITTKLVEDVPASGRTPSDLAREIEKEYATFVTNPVVTVSLAEFSGSQNQQVKIVSPGSEARSIPFSNDLTLLDVLIEIGGLTEIADGNNAVLVRKEGDSPKNYSLRVDDLIRKGDITANVDIKPGDIVLIPERWF